MSKMIGKRFSFFSPIGCINSCHDSIVTKAEYIMPKNLLNKIINAVLVAQVYDICIFNIAAQYKKLLCKSGGAIKEGQ